MGQVPESEWQTRKHRIDAALQAAGWKVVSFQPGLSAAAWQRHAVEEFPTANGPADYALFVEGLLFGVVEAKKLSLGPQNVLIQAERYARGVDSPHFDFRGLHVPFLYSTNGEVIWYHDVRHPLERSRRVSHFQTPASLAERLKRHFETDCASLRQLANQPPGLRPYQRDANAATELAMRIREFRNRPNPGIVVTVDMLSTGVDIPDLEFIVFLRPVKSRILFEQLLGRGTRRGERFPDKSHFTVFDCFDGSLLEYLRKASAFTREPPEKPSRTIHEIIDDIWQNRDRKYNARCLVKRLQRIDKEMSGEARTLFAAFVPDGDLAAFARQLPEKLATEFTGTTKLLRDANFQDLLVNYPRLPRRFIVAVEAQDEVHSSWLIRDGAGNEYKPEDYLAAFGRYVQENPDHIEAVRILLDRPQEWSTDALAELRAKLAASKLRFSEENLQKAYSAQYQKSLIDIISMVKHAARDSEPLLTAAERVDAALGRLTQGQSFNAEQARWLARIREHLIANLSIDPADFDELPVFSGEGGWGRANRDLDDRPGDFLRRINEALAA